MIKIEAGDVEFQKTLTDREKQYIHDGSNWISKLGREIRLKQLHNINYTLDMFESLSKEEQDKINETAQDEWDKIDHNLEDEVKIK